MAWLKCQMGGAYDEIPVGTVLFNQHFSGAQNGSDWTGTTTLNTAGVETMTITATGSTGARGTGYVYTDFYVFRFNVNGVNKVYTSNLWSVSSNRDDQWHTKTQSFAINLTAADLAQGTSTFIFEAWYNPGGEWWDGTCYGDAIATITAISY